MSQYFQPGDFLIYQLEAGYAVLRLLEIEEQDDELTWHLAAYSDFYLDVEMAETAIHSGNSLRISQPHLALTTRAFESTQVAKIANIPLTADETVQLNKWRDDPNSKVSDKSVRLLLGLR